MGRVLLFDGNDFIWKSIQFCVWLIRRCFRVYASINNHSILHFDVDDAS